MNSRELRAKLAGLRHPTDEDLFLYLDGELGPRKKRKLQEHLLDCWNCRVEIEEMSRGIAKAVRLRNELAGSLPGRWDSARFERAVLQLLREEPGRSWWRHLLRIHVLSVRSAMLSVAVVFVLLWIRLSSPAPVSAHQLYRRAETEESRRLHPIEEPVIHQRIRISRRAAKTREIRTVETWTHVRPSRHAQRGGDGLWREVAGTLELNRLNAERPLSPGSYRMWAEALPAKRQVVEARELPDGSPAWVIRTTAARSGPLPHLEQAELVLRQADFHPVQENLRVRAEDGDQEYELTELAFDIVPAASVNPVVFHDRPLLAPRQAEIRPLIPPPQVATPLVSVPLSQESPDELTLEALYVLHQMHACVGEPFKVLRSGRDVVVKGFAESADRKAQVLAAFRKLPGLTLDIRTLEETGHDAAEPKESEVPVQPPTVLEAHRGPEYLGTLADKSIPSAQLTAISNQAVEHSNAWLLEAWALRRLSGTFPAEVARELGPFSTGLLEKMVRDHAESIRRHAAEFRAALQPAFTSSVTDLPADGRIVSWPASAESIFEAASRAQRLAQILFTGEGLLEEPATAAMEHLLSYLSALEDCSRDLDTHAAELFQGNALNFQSGKREQP